MLEPDHGGHAMSIPVQQRRRRSQVFADLLAPDTTVLQLRAAAAGARDPASPIATEPFSNCYDNRVALDAGMQTTYRYAAGGGGNNANVLGPYFQRGSK
jgi:hypothetical protein